MSLVRQRLQAVRFARTGPTPGFKMLRVESNGPSESCELQPAASCPASPGESRDSSASSVSSPRGIPPAERVAIF